MFRAIIFDLDGTLVDAYPGIHQSLNETLRELHLPEVDLQTVKRRVGRGVVNLLQQSVPSEMVERGLDLFRASYDCTHLSGTFLLPDVRETLEELRKRNIALGIASNKPADFTRNILKHLQIHKYFSFCGGPEGEIQPKPHPSMLQSMMHNMQVSPEETLYVGDMTLDSETAKNAGVRLALIPTGGHRKEELEEIQPDYMLERIRDVVGIIERGS
jgi:2-phosphoglycolate phosphatase